MFESFGFLIFFPLILLAVILSCKYAVIDENEYHQIRLLGLLDNEEVIERIVEDEDNMDNQSSSTKVKLQEVMHYQKPG